MRRTVTLGALALFSASMVLGGSCMWGDPDPAPNIAPVINSFNISGEVVESVRVRAGDRPTITVSAWDGNGDVLGEDSFTWSADLGTVDGYGPSIRYEPPTNIVWENPPQQVIDTITVTVTDGQPGSEPATRTLDVEVLPPCPANNQEPVVNSISASPVSIDLGDRTTITIDAVDPEGEDLTYEWAPPFGYMDGTGSTVDWVTTDVCCTLWYSIEVTVSDGCTETWTFVEVEVTV